MLLRVEEEKERLGEILKICQILCFLLKWDKKNHPFSYHIFFFVLFLQSKTRKSGSGPGHFSGKGLRHPRQFFLNFRCQHAAMTVVMTVSMVYVCVSSSQVVCVWPSQFDGVRLSNVLPSSQPLYLAAVISVARQSGGCPRCCTGTGMKSLALRVYHHPLLLSPSPFLHPCLLRLLLLRAF